MNSESKIKRLFAALENELGKHEPNFNGTTQSMVALKRAMADFNQKAQMEMEPGKREELKQKVAQYSMEIETFQRKIEQAKRSQLLVSSSSKEFSISPTSSANFNTDSTSFHAAKPPVTGNESNSQFHGNETAQSLREREQNSLHRSIQMVDDYYSMGVASIQNIRRQDKTLKEAQRRMLDMANSLGLSQDIIRWIERRSAQDMYIFWGGVFIIVTMFFAYLFWWKQPR